MRGESGFVFGDTIPIPAYGPPILPLKSIICAALGGRYLHQLSNRVPLIPGISKSQVSRLCGEIDGNIHDFLDRPLEGA